MRLTAAGVTAVIDGYTIVSSAHIEVGEAATLTALHDLNLAAGYCNRI